MMVWKFQFMTDRRKEKQDNNHTHMTTHKSITYHIIIPFQFETSCVIWNSSYTEINECVVTMLDVDAQLNHFNYIYKLQAHLKFAFKTETHQFKPFLL